MKIKLLILFTLLGITSSQALYTIRYWNNTGTTNEYRSYKRNATQTTAGTGGTLIGSNLTIPPGGNSSFTITYSGWQSLFDASLYNLCGDWFGHGQLTNYPNARGFPDDTTFNIYHGLPETNCILTLCIKNTDVVPHVYTVYRYGVDYAPEGGGNIVLALVGGAYGCVSWGHPCNDTNGFQLGLSPIELQYYPQIPFVTNLGVSYVGSTNYPATTNGPVLNMGYTNSPPTNIIWDSFQQTNAILSQQGGDQAILDALNKLRADTVAGANMLSNALANSGSGGLGTGDLAGVVGAVNSFHTDNTNLLKQLVDGMGTNTGAIPGLTTNGASANAAADLSTEAA